MLGINSNFLDQGIFIGLAVAVPVGPISILCIQRTLEKGLISGFISGIGASTGDVIYAFLSAFSLGFIATHLTEQKELFSLISGIFLCYLGVRTFLKKPNIYNTKTNLSRKGIKRNELLQDYITTLVLDLVNPMTILPFMAVLSRLYTVNAVSTSMDRGLFILGVFISAIFWRIFLSFVANWFSKELKPHQLKNINRISGILIAGFGFVSTYSTWS